MKKQSSNTSRKLKVQSKNFARSSRRYVFFPEIRLSGKWLQELGFAQGQTVTVTYEQNRLTIEREK